MTFDYEKIAREMIFHQLLYHPLPWTIEMDWTAEVTAADGFVVAKTTNELAVQIIELANQLSNDLKNMKAEDDAC